MICYRVRTSNTLHHHQQQLHGPPVLVDKTSFGLVIIIPTFISLRKHLVIGQLNKYQFFCAFHRSTSNTPLASWCITVQWPIENTVRAVHNCNSWALLNTRSTCNNVLNKRVTNIWSEPIDSTPCQQHRAGFRRQKLFKKTTICQ